MELWDVVTGRLLRTFKGSTDLFQGAGWFRSVAFSPDGKHVLSGSLDKTLKLWNVATGQVWRTFKGHLGGVLSVAFSPDGSRVVSGSEDHTLKLWDVATGQVLRTFEGHLGFVSSVAFSPDGLHLASGAGDGTIRIWWIGSGAWLGALLDDGEGEKWIATTPTGFFVASQKGTQLIGITRGLDIFSVDQIHQSLFNPDLVREALAGDPNAEVRDAAKLVSLESVVSSGPPPVVAITSHPIGSESAEDLVTVDARITDNGKGVGRIEWRVNGVTAAVAAKPQAAGPDYDISQELALEPGENLVEVVAYNSSNLLAST